MLDAKKRNARESRRGGPCLQGARKQVFRHEKEAKRDSCKIQISKLVVYGRSYEWLEDSESQAFVCS